MSRVLVILLVLVISACGGGGAKNSPANTQGNQEHSAPTISGVMSTEIKSSRESIFILDVKNTGAESLNVRLENAPIWLDFEIKGNQLHFTASPSAFDVNKYEFLIDISNENSSSVYKYNLIVNENRDAWNYVYNLDDEYFLGHWFSELSDISFDLFENGKGYFHKKNSVYPISWSIDYETITLYLHEPGCTSCSVLAYVEVEPVYMENDRVRASIVNSDNSKTITNLSRKSELKPTADYYIPITHRSGAPIVSLGEDKISLLVYSGEMDIFQGSRSARSPFTLPISFMDNKVVAEFDKRYYYGENYSVIETFYNSKTTEYIELTLIPELVGLSILPSAGESIVVRVESKWAIRDTVGQNIEDLYFDNKSIKSVLSKTTINHRYYKRAYKAPIPELKINKSYIGSSLIKSDGKVSGVNYNGGGDIFYLTGGSTLEIDIESYLFDVSERISLNYISSGDRLSISYGNENYDYFFIKDSEENIMMVEEVLWEDEGRFNYASYFFEKKSKSFKNENYIGVFDNNFWSIDDEYRWHSIFQMDTGTSFSLSKEISNSLTNAYFNVDGSYSLITHNESCEKSMSYEACLDFIKHSGNSARVENFKLIKIDGDQYTFKYSFSYKYSDALKRDNPSTNDYFYDTVRAYTKLNN